MDNLQYWFYLLGIIYFIITFMFILIMIPLKFKSELDKRARREDRLQQEISELREEIWRIQEKLNPDPESKSDGE